MRGRVVAAEREAHAEKEDQEQRERRAERHRDEEDQKQNHLGDEELLPSQMVGQAAQGGGPDENPEQRRGSDHALLRVPQMELHRDQRQRDTGHEYHQPLEKFACRGEAPDLPLHDRHRNLRDRGSVRPGRRFVDILLDGFFQSREPFLSEMGRSFKEDNACAQDRVWRNTLLRWLRSHHQTFGFLALQQACWRCRVVVYGGGRP